MKRPWQNFNYDTQGSASRRIAMVSSIWPKLNKYFQMKKILVIDDHTQIRENIVEILSLAGYSAFGAEHGKQGVEKAIKEKPDLIICDIMMPELDGYGVL